MAKRHLTAKQIRAGFGGKRRKASLRSKPKKRHAPAKRNPPKGGGRVISGYGSTVMNRARCKKRRNPGGSHKIVINRSRKVKNRRNLAEIISWLPGNPARKRGKKMAHSKKKRRSSARRNTAGRSHSKKRMTRRHGRRSNPGFLGSPTDWVQGGAGVLGGVVVARVLPQLVLGASNAGPMGYGANLIAALGAGWLTHMIFPRNRVLTGAVVAGGVAATLARVIADRTPFGAQLSLTGLGDWGLGLYQKSNFNRPQHLVNGRPGTPGSSNYAFGPGSPYSGLPTLSNAGADTTANC